MRRLWHWIFNLRSWSVRYSDGAQSARFIYTDAKCYAKTFQGKVFFDPE